MSHLMATTATTQPKATHHHGAPGSRIAHSTARTTSAAHWRTARHDRSPVRLRRRAALGRLLHGRCSASPRTRSGRGPVGARSGPPSPARPVGTAPRGRGGLRDPLFPAPAGSARVWQRTPDPRKSCDAHPPLRQPGCDRFSGGPGAACGTPSRPTCAQPGAAGSANNRTTPPPSGAGKGGGGRPFSHCCFSLSRRPPHSGASPAEPPDLAPCAPTRPERANRAWKGRLQSPTWHKLGRVGRELPYLPPPERLIKSACCRGPP